MGRALHAHKTTARHGSEAPAPRQLSHKVAKAIRDRILNWQYMPGHHLAERVLCDEFAASRIPVREALNALVEQGLVERIQNQGCYVKQPDLRGVQELYDLRLALELFVVERLARTGLSSGWVEKEKAYWEPLLSIRADDPVDGADLMKADENFHMGLARALDNAHILEALSDLYERIRFVRMRVATTPHRIQTTAGEHLQILDAIIRHDPDSARRALWQNINQARNKVEIALTQALAGAMWSRPTNALLPSGT